MPEAARERTTEPPILTVVTPCFNSSAYVGRTIESVRAQTLTAWEQIVVDDGSTDQPEQIVDPIVRDEPRLKLVRKQNGGVASARNEGARRMSPSSRYLLFLDADDVLCDTMLAEMTAYLDSHPEVGMVHCSHLYIDPDDKAIPSNDWHIANMHRYVPTDRGLGVRTLLPHEAETPFASIYCIAGIIPSVSVMRRTVYDRTPAWDEEFGQHYEDTDMFLQMASFAKVHFLPRRLVKHRRHPGQNTADPARFGNQEAKLYAKWNRIAECDAERRSVIEAAREFHKTRHEPLRGFESGTQYLKSGQPARALRFYVGAIRRYCGMSR